MEISLPRVLERVSIRRSGAIVMGSHIAVDGHEPNYPFRVVTHIHSDHILDLDKSISECSLIIATPPTLEILTELGFRIPQHKQLCLDYGRRIELPDGELELVKSKHIVGSAQVLFIDHETELSIGYSSDFKEPGRGTPVMNVDVLVIESTYGRPEWSRPLKDLAEQALVDLVKQLLGEGPVYIYGYYGKLQEAMHILREGGIIAPFLSPPKVYRISKIAEKYGYKVGELYIDQTPEAHEIMKSGWYVYFEHSNRARSRSIYAPTNASHIVLTGWEFSSVCKRVGDRVWRVALSDHADFEDLLEYVRMSKPKLVIVDKVRAGQAAEVFAHEVRKRLDIYAMAMPA